MNNDYDLMKILEGCAYRAYRCTSGFVTVGVGFNMDSSGAKKIWNTLDVTEDFDKVYTGDMDVSEGSALKLFEYIWSTCEMRVRARCKELKLNYDVMPVYKKFVLKDIVYNTGSISNWYKVLVYVDPRDVIFEARRKPKTIMDSRVAKIAYQYGICKDLEDCIALGLEYTKYIK